MAAVDDLARAFQFAGMDVKVASGVATALLTAYTNTTGLATLSGTQTLTNKTLTSPTINTPVMSTITVGGQTVTLPAPGAADFLVSGTNTQSLSNKTLVSPVIGTQVTLNDAANVILGTTTGTKIGTATTQKLAFFNSTPVVKPAALTAAAAAVTGGLYTATEETLLNNLRTRIGELESRLQSLGLVT